MSAGMSSERPAGERAPATLGGRHFRSFTSVLGRALNLLCAVAVTAPSRRNAPKLAQLCGRSPSLRAQRRVGHMWTGARAHDQFILNMEARQRSLAHRLEALDGGLEALERLAEERGDASSGLSLHDLTRLSQHCCTAGGGHEPCAICLCPPREGEQLCTLACAHIFHLDCVRPWLERSAFCPTCRSHALGHEAAGQHSVEAAPSPTLPFASLMPVLAEDSEDSISPLRLRSAAAAASDLHAQAPRWCAWLQTAVQDLPASRISAPTAEPRAAMRERVRAEMRAKADACRARAVRRYEARQAEARQAEARMTRLHRQTRMTRLHRQTSGLALHAPGAAGGVPGSGRSWSTWARARCRRA